MTVEKGKPWEAEVDPGLECPTASDDADLASMAAEAIDDDAGLIARIAAGDLLTTLGLADGRLDGAELAYPLDLGLAYLDGDPERARPFVAHLTVRNRPALSSLLGHGPGIAVAVMNVALLGDLRLGPKAHPNDGLLDITEGVVPFRHRREATKRARSGSHLPHPDLTHRRVAEWERTFSRPASVWLDGVCHGKFKSVRVAVVPDALTVVA